MGYGFSTFENQLQTANALPGGAVFYVQPTPQLSFIIGYETTFFPYIFEFGDGEKITLEKKTSQTILKFNFQYNFADDELIPYIQFGVGRYTGRFKYHPISVGVKQEADYEPAIGYNIGIGVEYPVYPQVDFTLNGTYHLVQRRLEQSGARTNGYNNIVFYAGLVYRLGKK